MTIEPLTPQFRRFEISNVLRSTGAAIGRNAAVFFGLAILFQGLPTAILGYFQHSAMAPLLAGEPDAGAFASAMRIWAYTGVGALVSVVFSSVLQVALTHGVVNSLRGQTVSLSECLSSGLRYFLPAVGIGLSVGLCVIFGFVFFIVPGVILALGWCVAVPVLVAESRGVFGSISRAWRLTDGYKGSLFLLGLIFVGLSLVLSTVGQGIAAAFLATGMSTYNLILMAVISPLMATVSSVIGSAGVASAYYELRQVKEGVGVEALAQVFE